MSKSDLSVPTGEAVIVFQDSTSGAFRDLVRQTLEKSSFIETRDGDGDECDLVVLETEGPVGWTEDVDTEYRNRGDDS